MRSRKQAHPVLHLRYGEEVDRPAIVHLLQWAGMNDEIDPRECLIAESHHEVLGFARVEVIQQKAFIRPIVVHPSAQGKGVGRYLVQHLLKLWPTLQVVSRGVAQDFYHRLGFSPIPWEEIPGELRQECEGCPQFLDCQPIPMSAHGEHQGQLDPAQSLVMERSS